MSEVLQEILAAFGAEIYIDDSMEKTGADTGNLVAKIPGNVDVLPMILSGHLDTVEPGRGIEPVFNDGVFSSAGDTILAADDKSAIAIIIEILHVLKENGLKHGPLELVLTVCEEVGLLGAKSFDFSLIDSKFGYVLDSTDAEGIVTRAPFAYRFEFKIHGKAAHAGAAPEKGINAIAIAGTAIASIESGRVDDETTCNIGTIEGGVATNVVPPLAIITGEARGHDKVKLDEVKDSMVAAFETAVSEAKTDGEDLPYLEVIVETDFPGTNIPD
ncbi:MAG: M20/M25/M40 family metallo-hydrolase, partial [bacterium]|nr:M20/M25/M40 family metallo-hydrolase [bacterium]